MFVAPAGSFADEIANGGSTLLAVDCGSYDIPIPVRIPNFVPELSDTDHISSWWPRRTGFSTAEVVLTYP